MSTDVRTLDTKDWTPNIASWAHGRALVATGRPFPKVQVSLIGRSSYCVIAECNNALIFPGLGLGSILSQSRRVTDTMIIAGAKQLADLSPAVKRVKECIRSDNIIDPSYEYEGEILLPEVQDAPQANFEIGVVVAVQVIKEGSTCAECAKALAREGDEKIEQVVRVKAGQIS